MSERNRSSFLFATPSWYEGLGRLVDFANALTQYNVTVAPEDPDTRALGQDWLAVGDELRGAITAFQP